MRRRRFPAVLRSMVDFCCAFPVTSIADALRWFRLEGALRLYNHLAYLTPPSPRGPLNRLPTRLGTAAEASFLLGFYRLQVYCDDFVGIYGYKTRSENSESPMNPNISIFTSH